MNIHLSPQNKALGALMGQSVGDALGSQLEFKTAAMIKKESLEGLAREIVGSPVWNTIPGQITDDTEMAIAVLRSIVSNDYSYSKSMAEDSYVDWLNSNPFDVGLTIGSALNWAMPSKRSRSNGSLMRCSSIAAWGATVSGKEAFTALWKDAEITHADPVVAHTTALFGMAIRHAILNDVDGPDVFAYVTSLAKKINVSPDVSKYLAQAAQARPKDTDRGYTDGYCLVAFQHALYSLVSGESFEEAVTQTILSGGDTDTTAAIVGALLGSVLGVDGIPLQWRERVLNCVPDENTHQPRPERFHVTAFMDLAQPVIAKLGS